MGWAFAPLRAQVYLHETFETPNQVPPAWTATPFVTTGWLGWRVGFAYSLASSYFSIPGSSGVAAVNDDMAGQNGANPVCLLTTPALNLTDAASPLFLSFDLFFKRSFYQGGAQEVGDLWVSVDGGVNFTHLWMFNENDNAWQNLV